MNSKLIRLLAISVVSLFSANASAQLACTAPGLLLLEDPEGDWSGDFAEITGAPGVGLPEQDLLSLSLAQSDGADGEVLLTFTLKLASAPGPTLPPNAGWYSSFETPDGVIYGVRMQTNDSATPRLFSYIVAPSNGGQTDGRFIAAGSEKPAEAGSGISGDTITLIVKASRIGLSEPGQTLGPFNAASTQQAAVAGLRVDTAPDGDGRDGFYDVQPAGSCGGGKSGSGLMLGGGLGFALLLPLALMGLRRARRSLVINH